VPFSQPLMAGTGMMLCGSVSKYGLSSADNWPGFSAGLVCGIFTALEEKLGMGRLIACALLIGGGAFGQTFAERPSFEVASIKPHVRPPGNGLRRVGSRGGPGSGDPTRYSIENMTPANLVTMAYDIAFYQLSAPDWMERDRFDIAARVPEGSTKEQLPLMLQRLLGERFGLKVHFEKREMPAYELVVAKRGSEVHGIGSRAG